MATSSSSASSASALSTPAPVIRPKTSILDKSLSRGKQEVSLSAFALLFSEMVQYAQSRSSTVPELQQKLHDLGWQVGARMLDLIIATASGQHLTKAEQLGQDDFIPWKRGITF